MGSWYAEGPLEIWRELAADVSGRPVDGGHFFPEEYPRETAAALSDFFEAGSACSCVS